MSLIKPVQFGDSCQKMLTRLYVVCWKVSNKLSSSVWSLRQDLMTSRFVMSSQSTIFCDVITKHKKSRSSSMCPYPMTSHIRILTVHLVKYLIKILRLLQVSALVCSSLLRNCVSIFFNMNTSCDTGDFKTLHPPSSGRKGKWQVKTNKEILNWKCSFQLQRSHQKCQIFKSLYLLMH